MRMAAIYARVSSEQQREENTIASQTASLIEFANQHELEVPKEWVLENEGYLRFAIQNAVGSLLNGCLDQFLRQRVSACRRDFRVASSD